MIQPGWTAKRAVSALVAGLALFLFSCKPAVQLKKAPIREARGPEETYRKAEALFHQGKIDDALALYNQYLQAEPQGKMAAECLMRVGDIYLEKDKLVEALKSYSRLKRDFPTFQYMADVAYKLVVVLYRIGSIEEAIAEGEAWFTKYPESELGPYVALILGKAYYSKLEQSKALKWLMEAEQGLEQTSPMEAKEIGVEIQALIREADKAGLESMMEISRGSKYYPAVAIRLARICYRMDELEEAENVITELLQSPVEEKWLQKARVLYDKIFLALNVDPHKIGCLLPLSGPFAIYGQEVLNGIEMGMGLFGESSTDLEVVVRDTGGDPGKAADAVDTLVRRENVVAAMGPLLSRCAEQAAMKAETLGLPLITLCRKEDIVEKGHMIFRNFMLPKKEIERLVHVAMERLDMRRFAIMYPDNAYGRYFMGLFWDAVERRGGEIRAVESYDPSTTDFAAQIKRMVGLDAPKPKEFLEKLREEKLPIEEESELGPEEKDPIIDFEAVFIPDSAERVVMIAPQLVYHDILDIWLLGTSLWDSPRLLKLAKDYIQGAIFTSGFFAFSEDREVEQFVERYRNNYEKDPGLLAATGYDTVRFLQAVIKQAGPRTRNQMRNAIAQGPTFKGLTGDISFGQDGEVQKKPFVVSVLGSREVLFP